MVVAIVVAALTFTVPALTSSDSEPAPGAPADVTAQAVSSSRARVSWSAVNGAKTYAVETLRADGTRVATGTCACTSLVQAGLHSGADYRWTVSAATGSPNWSVKTSSGILTLPGFGTPNAPKSVTATPSPSSTSVAVSWVPGDGPAATSYTVGVYSGQVEVKSASCGCTSTVLPGLAPGAYSFWVTPRNSAGVGSSTGSGVVNVVSGCATGVRYCLAADATQLLGPVQHVASGFLHATYSINGANLIQPTSWRLNVLLGPNGPDTTPFDTARNAGASTITVLVSDAWYWATNGHCGEPSSYCGARPPWNDLNGYANWVSGYVRAVEATGRRPDYWDVQNEPDSESVPGNYFNSLNAQSATVPNEEQQFKAAYGAIKRADPTARVLGPSLSGFRPYPDGQHLDLSSFLTFSKANGLLWDAIAWHENGDLTGADWGDQPAETIGTHVAFGRQLVQADDPDLAAKPIALTEYGTQSAQLLPGWIVGSMNATESSNVAFADRTCYHSATDPSVPITCTYRPSTLDGLLLSTGGRTAAWWTYAFYAALVGNRVATSESDVTFDLVGSLDPAGAVHLLAGRHQTCTAPVNPDCSADAGPPPPAIDVPVSVALPWSGPARVTLRRISNVRGAVAAVDPFETMSVNATGGKITVVLPSVADGEAMTIDIAHA